MSDKFATLRVQHLPKGFRLIGQDEGIHVGEFWGSQQQVALRYREPRRLWGLGSEITVCWAPERNLMLTGTTNRVGVTVTVKGHQAIYHDGMWMPGPGLDQVEFEPDGQAHWGRELVHSLTLHTSKGVYGLRCPQAAVPGLDALIRIMSSVPAQF